MERSFSIKLASLIVTSGVGLGIFGSQYFQRTSTDFNGKIGGYYLKKGFKITSYNDSIWGEEFERYKRSLNDDGRDGFFPKALTSIDQLRNKCRELTEFEFNNSTDSSAGAMLFASNFCMGRTTLKNWIDQSEEDGIINIDSDEDIWDAISSSPEITEWTNKAGLNRSSNKENLKQEIKNYCKGVNWNQEMRNVDEKTSPIFKLCMAEKEGDEFVIRLTKKHD